MSSGASSGAADGCGIRTSFSGRAAGVSYSECHARGKSQSSVLHPRVGILGGASACDSGETSTSSTTSCLTDRALSGAIYDIGKSRFSFGSQPVQQKDGNLIRWVGVDGALAIFSDGSERASLNGGAPEANLADWSADTDKLSAHVRDYFVAMGVATCQIANLGIDASGSAGGPVDGGALVVSAGPNTVVLSRAIDSIPIAESVAVARFDVNDQTTAEGLHWPEISAELVTSAITFRNRLKDSQALADYKTKLPDDAQGDGQVMIHHSSAGTSSAFQAVVVYEVTQTFPADAGVLLRGLGESLDFDSNGVPAVITGEPASK
jgi:hypothetical protein